MRGHYRTPNRAAGLHRDMVGQNSRPDNNSTGADFHLLPHPYGTENSGPSLLNALNRPGTLRCHGTLHKIQRVENRIKMMRFSANLKVFYQEPLILQPCKTGVCIKCQ